jgi:hypothetical protein
MIKVKNVGVCSQEDEFIADILRTVGKEGIIYKLVHQMEGNPPPVQDCKNNWDIDIFDSPLKKDVEVFIPKCINLGVYEAFNAYGDNFMKNGEKFCSALKSGILYYLLPYDPFVNAFTPHDAMMGSLPVGLYEVSFYYLKPFVSQEVCSGITSTGGNQDLLYPRIWNNLVFKYEFIHWAVLETICGRCFYDELLDIHSEDKYQFKISKSLLALLVMINNEVCGDIKKVKDIHWVRIIENFGESWCSIYKFV